MIESYYLLFTNKPKVFIYLLGFLDQKSLSKASLLNKRWNQLASDPKLHHISKRNDLQKVLEMDKLNSIQLLGKTFDLADIQQFVTKTKKYGVEKIFKSVVFTYSLLFLISDVFIFGLRSYISLFFVIHSLVRFILQINGKNFLSVESIQTMFREKYMIFLIFEVLKGAYLGYKLTMDFRESTVGFLIPFWLIFSLNIFSIPIDYTEKLIDFVVAEELPEVKVEEIFKSYPKPFTFLATNIINSCVTIAVIMANLTDIQTYYSFGVCFLLFVINIKLEEIYGSSPPKAPMFMMYLGGRFLYQIILWIFVGYRHISFVIAFMQASSMFTFLLLTRTFVNGLYSSNYFTTDDNRVYHNNNQKVKFKQKYLYWINFLSIPCYLLISFFK